MKPSTTNREAAEVDLALCRATLYSAFALGFRSPTKETIDRLVTPENAAALMAAATILERQGGVGLVNAVGTLARAGQVGTAALAASYRTLFGHTARASIPPYETEYGSEALFQQPQELGDVMGFYRAFGLALKITEGERPDHVSCECEFLAFLALKEAYALEHQNQEMLNETRKAYRLFLKDHLARFLPAFARKLKAENPGGFYGILGEFCLAFVRYECGKLAVPIGLEGLGLRPAADDGVPMACGSGAECLAMPGALNPECE